MHLYDTTNSYNFYKGQLDAINNSIDELQEFSTLVHKTIGKRSKLGMYIKQVATAIVCCISKAIG